MSKTKIAAAALAALTLTTGLAASTSQAEAKWKPGYAVGFGVAAGVLVGAALAANAHAAPVYAYPGYRCRFVKEYDAYGYLRTVRVCRLPY